MYVSGKFFFKQRITGVVSTISPMEENRIIKILGTIIFMETVLQAPNSLNPY